MHPKNFRRLRSIRKRRVAALERLELRAMMSVVPTGELTEGNAAAWEAFADSATASVSNDATHVRVGSQSLKFDTTGGFDTWIRRSAPAGNWNITGFNQLAFWTFGENANPWQGNQPVIELESATGTRRLTPNTQLMPNHAWAFLAVPLAGDEVWQVEDTGTYDPANIAAVEIHQDTWDFGFVAYYDGVQFRNYTPLDSPVLESPHGVATDSNHRTLVVENDAHRVRIHNAAGKGVQLVGGPGTGNGQFDQPSDIAVGAGNQFYVVDTGNNRVQRFHPDGSFVSAFGGAGNNPGQFDAPQGITIDPATGKVYVADRGNHRVQRFLADGTLDTSWGGDGVVGTTDVIARDHTGFDSPSDVAVNPVTGQVYVADFGNHRLEVFDASGNYQRTYLAVYRPQALAFDAAGNLYIAGEDPNDGYTAFDGRLRLLKAGDELISKHYTGGVWDDIGRIERGVTVRGDGKIIFSDTLNDRIVQFGPGFQNPVTNVQVKAIGTSVTFTWTTLQAGASTVRFGTNKDAFSNEVTNPFVTRTHSVTINNTTPNTRLFYQLSLPDSFNGEQRFTQQDVINTGVPLGQTQFARAKSIGFVYTDGQDGEGFTRRPEAEIEAMKARYEMLADYYWRSSGFKLLVDFQILEVDRDLSAGTDMFQFIQPELEAFGFTAADDIDGVYFASPFAAANLGGGDFAFGRIINSAEWQAQTDFVALHEINHSLDNMYGFSDLSKYEGNHGIWAVQGGLGHDFSTNAQILKNMLPANLTAVGNMYKTTATAPDADNDGLPDSSPAGLFSPLPMTEATFGSSTSSADTDGDGLSDLKEATALINGSTDPNNPDSDGDGVRDGVDLNPAYPMNDLVVQGSPTIDGAIGPGEGWTVLTDNWAYDNLSLVGDDNDRAHLSTTYAAWDDQFLYLALQGPPGFTGVQLDGNADNRFFGPENYQMHFLNVGDNKSVAVNAGVPDVFRQIDNNGGFSELFDTNPMFTAPYNGRTTHDHPGEGLGFPGRLVTEADLTYQFGANGNDSVWEVKIPWSNVTQLRGGNGKEMAISFNSEGDRFFEMDGAARIRLVAAAVSKPTVTLNASPLQYTENKPALLLAPAAVVTDHDSFDLAGGVLSVAVVAGAGGAERLAIQSAGMASGQVGLSGSNVFYGGVQVGTLTGGNGATPLAITLNANATPVVVQAIVRSLTFRLASENPNVTARTIRFTLTDGDGQTSSPVSMTVGITAVNDAPLLNNTLNPTLPTIPEDAANPSGRQIYNLVKDAFSDPDGVTKRGIAVIGAPSANGVWQYSLDGSTWLAMGAASATAARLVPGTGRVRFLPKPNFHGQVTLTYRAWDQTQGTAGQAFNLTGKLGGANAFSTASESATITVTPVNDRPVITLSGSVGYVRNAPPIVLVPNAGVADVDSTNFGGGNLRVRIVNHAGTGESNRLAIGNGFTVDANNNVRQGATIIGRLNTSGGVGTKDLTVTFNTAATKSVVQSLVRSITFKTVGGVTGKRSVYFSVSDGDGGGYSEERLKTVNVI